MSSRIVSSICAICLVEAWVQAKIEIGRRGDSQALAKPSFLRRLAETLSF